MKRINTTLSRVSPLAPLVLRIAIGGIMLYHGIDKLRGGMDGVEGMFTTMDVPAPAVSAPLVTALEVIGGIALLAGLVALLLLGPGNVSADRAVGLEPALT